VETALRNYQPDSLEHRALTDLLNLQLQVDETIEKGVRVFGKGVFRLFDFIADSLPKDSVEQLKFYNRVSFFVFDRYLSLRDINRELNEQMSQLLVGLSKYADMKVLLIKGAEKAYEDALKKFRASKNIE